MASPNAAPPSSSWTPALLVASVSERQANSHNDWFSSVKLLPGASQTATQSSSSIPAGRFTEAAGSSSGPLHHQYHHHHQHRPLSHNAVQLDSFQLRPARRGPHPPHHPAARVQRFLHQAAGLQDMEFSGDVAPPVVMFLNHHVLPFLAFVAAHQAHAVRELSERARSWRIRNPFQRKHRDSKRDTDTAPHMSSIYQHRGPKPNRQGLKLFEAALAQERKLDPLGAAALFEQAAEADTRHAASWLALAAKQWSDATYLDFNATDKAVEYNSRAVEMASRATELAPDAAGGYIARCISQGRLALYSDNRSKVHMARLAADDAAKALQLEPENDFAHHLMGRWHYEMAGLNPIARTLVRMLYGTSLMQGSYPQALEHYRTAVQLAPRTLVHKVELGRTLAKLGQVHDAAAELEEALQCEVEDLNGHLQKLDAGTMLAQLRRSPALRGFSLLPPAPPAAAATSSTAATNSGNSDQQQQ